MATLTLSGAGAGGPSGQVVFGPITTTASNNQVYEMSSVSLAVGDNTFSFPAGQYTAVVLSFPNSAGGSTIKYRTSLDASPGVTVTPNGSVGWFKADIPTAATSITVNVTSALSGIGLGFI